MRVAVLRCRIGTLEREWVYIRSVVERVEGMLKEKECASSEGRGLGLTVHGLVSPLTESPEARRLEDRFRVHSDELRVLDLTIR